jgi:diaminopimelate epimerase
MPEIPFVKAHGAGNDFLLTWRKDAASLDDLPSAARAICARHTGVGADGWLVVDPHAAPADASIVLYNSDGSIPELSGNGTRCAAAWLIHSGAASKQDLHIATGAGGKTLRLIRREGNHFEFEMNMGTPRLAAEGLHARLALGSGAVDAVLVNVGNPQCVVLCDEFPSGWRELGAALEHHPHFPNRTNVSFVRVLDEHTIDVLFWERGAGETQSSGTGSTGAAAAAILRGAAKSPVTVQTPAGPLHFRWEGEAWLIGPAEITARGVFFL